MSGDAATPQAGMPSVPAATPAAGVLGRLRTKPAALVLAVLGAGWVLLTSSRTWATGTVHDAVLGASTVTGTGADLAPGLSAVALVLAAAAIAVVTGGRVVRLLSVVVEGAALAGLVALVVRVILDPSGLLGPLVAGRVARSGSVPTVASATDWPWLALVGVLVALLGWVGAVLGMRRWSGPSERYERRPRAVDGSDAAPSAGARGQRVSSVWDQLDAGQDPTEGEDGVGGDRSEVGPDSQT